LKDARLSESEKQKYNRLVSIKFYQMNYSDKLTGEDAIVGVIVMPVVLADVVLVGCWCRRGRTCCCFG